MALVKAFGLVDTSDSSAQTRLVLEWLHKTSARAGQPGPDDRIPSFKLGTRARQHELVFGLCSLLVHGKVQDLMQAGLATVDRVGAAALAVHH